VEVDVYFIYHGIIFGFGVYKIGGVTSVKYVQGVVMCTTAENYIVQILG